MREKRPGIREFRVDDYGAPAYPELVLTVTRETLEDQPSLVRAAIRALQRGYTQTQNDPESAVSTMLEREPGLERAALAAQLDAVAPAFTAGAAEFGAAAAGPAASVGGVGRALRDPEGADRRDARLRHDARQAPADSLTGGSIGSRGTAHGRVAVGELVDVLGDERGGAPLVAERAGGDDRAGVMRTSSIVDPSACCTTFVVL